MDGGLLSLLVRNIGGADAAGVVVEVLQDGQVLASQALPTIQTSVHDLTPRPIPVALSLGPSHDPARPIVVRLVPPPGTDEISQSNNSVAWP